MANISNGSKSFCAFGEEASFAVFPTTSKGLRLGFTSESLTGSRNTFSSQRINANRMVQSIRTGNVSAGGTVGYELGTTHLGLLFKHALLGGNYTTTTVTPVAIADTTAYTRGTYVLSNGNTYLCTLSGTTDTTAVSTGLLSSDPNFIEPCGTAAFQYYGASTKSLYKHVLNAGAILPAVGIAYEKGVYQAAGAISYFRYLGGRVNQVTLGIPQEGALTASFDMLFLDQDIAGATSKFNGYTDLNEEPVAAAQCMVRIKAGSGAFAVETDMQNGQLTLNNQFDPNLYAVGSVRRRDLVEGQREVSLSGQFFFTDLTRYNQWLGESTLAVELTAHYAGQMIQIDLPTTKIGGNPTPSISGNGAISVPLELRTFSPEGNTDLTLTLYNGQATY